MVSLTAELEMRGYWNKNRESLLDEYTKGYLVISISPIKHEYFATLREAYKQHPILKDNRQTFGITPLLVDIKLERTAMRSSSHKGKGLESRTQ
ncbi:MAG: hypothetical protein WCK90_04765 [archaeon]